MANPLDDLPEAGGIPERREAPSFPPRFGLLAVHFEQAGQRYVLTSQGRLFCQPARWDPEKDDWPEVTNQKLALRVLFTELAKHLPAREEPEP